MADNWPIVGEQTKPKLWRVSSLRSFGTNPYGENLFRVVWGPSRMWLVGGPWEDHHGVIATNTEIAVNGKDPSFVSKRNEYRWVPKYPSEQWVLERWLSPIQYAGPPEVWAEQERVNEVKLGPYPEKGEFEACYAFDQEPPASAVERVISMLIFGSQYTPAERKAALQAEQDGKKWDWRNKCEAIWKDSQGAFNNLPSNVNPAKRTADKVDLTKPLPDLPSGDNKFFTA